MHCITAFVNDSKGKFIPSRSEQYDLAGRDGFSPEFHLPEETFKVVDGGE